MAEPRDPVDLPRTIFGVLCIAGLAMTSLWILRPFLAAGIWAATIVVATWPVLRWLEQRLRGRRLPAAIIMTIAMLVIIVLPALAVLLSLAGHVPVVIAWIAGLSTQHLPEAPEWVSELPLMGDWAAATWNGFAGSGFADLAAHLQPYMGGIARWMAGEASALGLLLVQAGLIVVISAMLYMNGEAWAAWLLRLGWRLGGEQGGQAVTLAGQAIRGVALGVVVTAFLQALLGGLGLLVASVPFAGMLTALMFVLCIAQIGPSPVLGIAAVWLYFQDAGIAAGLLVAWAVAVGLMDSVLRPLLIRRSAELPLLLIFAGVIGGMLGFGLIGIFVGPVVLAVAYTLLSAWMDMAGQPHSSDSHPAD